MLVASTVRRQIEAALADKIPSALTPAPRAIRPVASTGVAALDDLLQGGLPVGALSELVGPECSGRTSVALSFVSALTRAGKVCAWVDVSNALDPVSAAAAGIDLARLLWIRCNALDKPARRTRTEFVLPGQCFVPPPSKRGLHGGGFGLHPRSEANGLSKAVSGLLRPEFGVAEPQRRARATEECFAPAQTTTSVLETGHRSRSGKPWTALDQALRAADLLLQAGGFSAIILDMGSIAADYVSRVSLATWFRYRAAAQRTQSSIVLLTQYPCAKSSSEVLLRFRSGEALRHETTVFSGVEYGVELERRRFTPTVSNVVPMRKPPQNVRVASWESRTREAGRR